MRTEEKTIITKYWEAGDLFRSGDTGKVHVVLSKTSSGWGYAGDVVGKNGLAIPTQDEINNYRLEKCKKDYPIGTVVRSIISDKDFRKVSGNFNITIVGVFVSTSDGGSVALYRFEEDKYAEIVSEPKEDKSIEDLLDEHLAIFREGFLNELKK